ncbi:uncharacterized protein LOC132734344 [Ruditapes philippinarum]|uniref:uncharacterized protein LOC132734344 n=1 Tax=Ruditapes philippinarum TaxID=129788 RepID=UPI00295A8406|nr:uncharacterized protein LOC132734344 [Ruditapes philippinarum]
MDFEKLFQHPEYENYVCVNLALVFVCQLLKPYTEQGLQQVHQDIKNKLAGKSKCTGTCGNQPSRWCQPCKSWQKPLQSHSTKRPIDWTKHTTANWEESFENIASVFTTLPGDGTPANYLDLSNACSIWERCKAFEMKKVVINNVRKCRNKYFAHNDTLRVDGNSKAEVFDALRDLLNDKDVGSHIDKILCMDKLQKIMNTPCLQNTISNIKKNFDHQSEKTIESLSKSTAMVSEKCEILKDIQYELKKLNQNQTRVNLEIIDNLHDISKMVKTTNKSLKKHVLAMFVYIAVAFTIAGRYISGNNKPDWNGISSNNMANNIPAGKLKNFVFISFVL